METHRPTYLASKAWITLPWQNHPKSSWDSLLDLLAEGPEILQKADRLEGTPPHQFLPAVLEMIEDLLALENRMQVYYADLSRSYSEPLFWDISPVVTGVNDFDGSTCPSEPAIRSALHFRDVEMARILTLYWAIQSMVWSGLNDLWGAVQGLTTNNSLGPEFEQLYRSLALGPRDWLDPIRKVCQSLDFCNSEASQGLGPMVIAVPLDVVLGVMKNRSGCDAEYKEARRVRQDVSRNWLRVLQFSSQSG
jgi:hypothetical protein